MLALMLGCSIFVFTALFGLPYLGLPAVCVALLWPLLRLLLNPGCPCMSAAVVVLVRGSVLRTPLNRGWVFLCKSGSELSGWQPSQSRHSCGQLHLSLGLRVSGVCARRSLVAFKTLDLYTRMHRLDAVLVRATSSADPRALKSKRIRCKNRA